MKFSPSRSVSLLAAILLFTEAARAQTFTDLNFEQATIVPTDAQSQFNDFSGDDEVEASAALPGWTVEYGTTTVNVIFGAPDALDQIAVQMIGERVNLQTGNLVLSPGEAIDGNFSVDLYGVKSSNLNPTFPTVASISQTGQIPTNAKSIEFLVENGVNMQPTVSFDGNIINVSPLLENDGVFTMIGDVSQYAGTTGLLTFSAIPTEFLPGQTSGVLENEYILDDISFSAQAAPEPSSWALAVLAAASLVLVRYRCRKA